MVPNAFASGESERRGHITRQGSGLVRSLLVEVAWAGLRHNAWMRKTYHRLSGGKKARRKIAMAVGRKLLVRCWAMLRDNCAWDWPTNYLSRKVIAEVRTKGKRLSHRS